MESHIAVTLGLYRDALRKTWQSLLRGWITIVAVIGFVFLLMLAQGIAAPLGIAGGFLLGAVNALLVGATLSLIEQSIVFTRTLTAKDVFDSFGRYFWDVISVGFVLWIPLMVLDMGTRTNPNGLFLSYAVMLLIFILLNPAPEVMYLTRHNSPLDVIKGAYEFVLENWIEWFLPIAILLIPLLGASDGLSTFFHLSRRMGRGAGLDFSQILMLPFTILEGWLSYIGIAPPVGRYLVLLLTPVLAVMILLFRGHLFAMLSGSTRRQRQFAAKFRGNE